MEWVIGESNGRYTAKLSSSEESLILTSLSLDGVEQSHSEISFRRDSQPGRILVEINGQAKFALVAKVGDNWWIHIDGRIHIVHGHEPGSVDKGPGEGGMTAPMPGVILDVMVKEGQRVREGQTLLVMEAMKMEHRILAPKPGEVISVNYTKGERVDMGATLVELGE
tara:strand:+ start:2494 stop:2994 length:501 start_codon:yes stop_codon:yes gene_type:complete